MVKVEYEILKNYADVSITFIPQDDLIDDEGLIKATNVKTKAKFSIKLKDQTEELVLNYQVELDLN